jgi:aerobic-type carbon monoxide dehydrogenase small subunit (CoxS/CutS family)
VTTNENSGPGQGQGHGQGHGQGPGDEQGRWQPIPHGGEYDAEATAFVQLPPEDVMDAPLAAPGHGYVPPQIVPLTPASDPQSSSWGAIPHQQQHQPVADDQGGVRWPEPGDRGPGGQDHGQGQGQAYYDAYVAEPWNYAPDQGQSQSQGQGQGFGQEHGRTQGGQTLGGQSLGGQTLGGQTLGGQGHGHFPDDGGGAGAGADTGRPGEASAELTGQWAIPVAPGNLPEESGEYSGALLASPWSGGTPPATLPGGAPAPWATVPEPEPEPVVAEPPPAEPVSEPLPEAAVVPEGTGAPDVPEAPGLDPVREADLVPEQDLAPDADPEAEPDPEAPVGAEPESEALSEALPEPLPEPEPAPLTSSSDSPEHPANSYVLRVNGADRPVTDSWIGESLLYVLRERLGLAGAKDGCSQGECGACNVQVDGRLVASCLVPAATAAGSEVRTVEGLAADGEPSDVQRALANQGAVQCGFCIPGMAMTVHDLLEGNHAPSELETRQALCGNLCRCSGYRGVLDAVNEVAAQRAASAEAAAAASEEARVPHQAPPGAGGAGPSHPHSHDGGMA